MSFDSFGEFLQMGGHALYVWLAYGVAILIFTGNWFTARSNRKQTLRRIQQRLKREQVMAE